MKDKEYAINKARNFALNAIYGQSNNKVDAEDYFLLVISNFLLLKEHVVKKNFHSKTLYFNYEANKKYLDKIKIIVDAAEASGEKIISDVKDIKFISVDGKYNNPADAKYTNPKYDKDKEYILKFHKIRDSLAHGHYDIDFDKKIIKLNNVSKKVSNGTETIFYKVVCDIRLEELESFSVFYENQGLTAEDGISTVNIKRSRYFVSLLNSRGRRIIRKYSNKQKNHKRKKQDDTINRKSQMKVSFDFPTNIKSYKKFREIESLEMDDIRESLLYVNAMLGMIYSSKFCKTKVGKEKFEIIRNIAIDINDQYKNKTRNTAIMRKRLDGLEDMIDTLINTRGAKFAAIYNYMQTYLSNKSQFIEELIDEEDLNAIASIDFSKLKYYYKNTKEYDAQIANIVSVVEDKIETVNSWIEDYYRDPHPGKIEKINDSLFRYFYPHMLARIGKLKKHIINSIRNGVDHGNVDKRNTKLLIMDVNATEYDKKSVFVCLGDPEDYFEVIDNINTVTQKLGNKKLDESLPIEDFDAMLVDLKSILGKAHRKGLYSKFLETYKKVIEINRLSVLNTLRNVEAKQSKR